MALIEYVTQCNHNFDSLQVLRVETTGEDDVHWLYDIRGYLEEKVKWPIQENEATLIRTSIFFLKDWEY